MRDWFKENFGAAPMLLPVLVAELLVPLTVAAVILISLVVVL